MPRKSKEKNEELNNLEVEIKPVRKAVSSKSTRKNTTVKSKTNPTKKNATTKKESKTTRKVATAKKETKSNKKVATKKEETKTTKKLTTAKKEAKSTKKTSVKKEKSTKKVATVKKETKSNKKTSAKKEEIKVTKTAKKSTKSKKSTPVIATEYYDLPFRYNETVVKILAQTPTTLFIYWDISDNDRNSYVEKYGEDFFYRTKPYLIITNETMHYSFDVEINDFANSWYLHVNDANCEYKVELGRKFITDSPKDSHFVSYHTNDYLYITSSNEMEMPNNHILFDKLGKSVFFRNVKTNVIEEKNISSISFLQKIGKVYNIYDLYKEIYGDELIYDEFGLNLPSSNNSSSFK